MTPSPVRRIHAAFAEAGVTGSLHAVDIDSGAQIDAGADRPVVTASVHKLCLLVALYRQGADAVVDLTERVECAVAGRTAGPTGLAALLDPVSLSLRDAAHLMMTVSDNAAADLLMARVGTDAVNRATASLGLEHTLALHDFAGMLAMLREDIGPGGPAALLTPHALARLRVLDPARTNRTTPRDMTRLLTAVWTDEAAPAEHCAAMRRVMGLQVWPHRLASGFPFDDVRVAGKTGSLPTVRNEVGVVEYPDGGRYAVAVFTRSASTAANLPDADAAIGTAARMAVDALRAR